MLAKYVLVTSLIALAISSNEVYRSNSIFSTKLYDALSSNSPEDNLVYSPLGVHTLLALVYEGSAGATESELRNILSLPDKSATASGYGSILRSINQKANVTVEVANKVYIRQGYSLKQNFRDVAVKNFLAEADNLDMTNTRRAAEVANAWVQGKTNDKIQNLLSADDIDKYTRAILLNAIYFKGKWQAKFDAENTKTEPFYLVGDRTVNCPMMHRPLDYYNYAEDGGLDAQFLNLKFRDGRFSLLIALPNKKDGIEDLQKNLEGVALSKVRQSLYGRQVDLSLPRFKIESRHELKLALNKIGLERIFSDVAEFPDIIDNDEPLTISKIVQKATIEINEEGGEASAGTGILIAVPISSNYRPPPPAIFKADHPFLFFLTFEAGFEFDEFGPSSDVVILFSGRVDVPEVVA